MRKLQAYKQKNERTIILIMLYFIAFVGVFAVDFYLPAIPAIASEFQVPPGQLGLTMSSYTLMFALGHLIVGPMSDAIGRKRTFEMGLIVSIAGTLFCMLSSGFWELIFARALQGFGLSCFVLTNAIIRDVFPNQVAVRVRITRNLVSYFLIAVAPSIGAVVVSMYDWRVVFGLFLISSIVIFLYVKILGVETNTNVSKRIDVTNISRQYMLVIKDAGFIRFSLISALAFSIHYCFVTVSVYSHDRERSFALP